MTSNTSILILGAGELGVAMLRAFVRKDEPTWDITVLLRPETANLPRDAPKVAPIYALAGVKILPLDLLQSSQSELASAIKPFDVVIGCTGYDNNGAGQGLQSKIARAVLESGTATIYIPWQFGVEYDLFDYGDAGGLFDEQKNVRKLLRDAVAGGKTKTHWITVSTGIFMSYLFSSFWDVVQRKGSEGWTVNALGSWDVSTTVTTPEDIGTATAAIVATALSGGQESQKIKNQAVYIAGDTVSYAQLIEIIRDATGKPTRPGHELTMQQLQDRLDAAPEDILSKYRVAFGRGRGVSWDKTSTFTHRHGIPMQDARSWAAENLQ